MKRFLLSMPLLALPSLAAAELALSPGIGSDPMTCAQYGQLDLGGQVEALSALPTAGDDLESGDQSGAEQWAETILAACAGHPDKLLADVASAELEGN